MSYVVYHLHTEQSLLDSCTNYKLYVDRAKELGQTAICFSEHGNIFNWVAKKLYCDENNIKYMHGVEVYLTERLYFIEQGEEKKVRDNYHTVLIAKNYEGVKEINKLINLSTQPDHFYYKPRITFDEFFAISDNVIKISACLASPLNKLRDTSNHRILNKLLKAYDYFEVQAHNMQEQKEYNKFLIEQSKLFGTPLIAGTDTHSIDNYKAECRTILQLAKEIEFQGEDTCDLTYKTRSELQDMFTQQGILSACEIESAIENTLKMAETVDSFELDMEFKYPVLYDNEEEVLWQTLRKKYKEKIDNNIIDKSKSELYANQIKEEMRVFKKIGMVGFILFMSEMVTWCRDNGIPVGFCRGSVGGSVVCYIADIIDVNPIKWGTVFSRFCNEDRTEIGDIDIDFSPDQRESVYKYIIDRFGYKNTAYILASGTVSEKGTIDEIGRALSFLWNKKNSDYTNNPWNLMTMKQIKDEFESDPEGTRQRYPELFYYYDGIKDTVVSQSVHPAGIIASPIDLIENYCCFNSGDKNIISINMEECHEISLVKYDILGLKNVQVIRNTCEYANIPYPLSHEIDWNDQKVWSDIVTSPIGIFQFESDFAFKSLQKMQPKNIYDMSLVNASVRPSGVSYRERLLVREKNIHDSEQINELLKDNNGWLVYQEDTIKFLQEICGLSGSEADNVRRAIGRKQRDRLEEAMPSILEGYCEKSTQPREIAEEEVKHFLQVIEDSSNYQFGYNHSLGYTMISYTCGMLRYYYPLEFTTALLNNANDDADLKSGTELAKQKGIQLYSPKFRKSNVGYVFDKETNSIYKGIDSIKHLNVSVAQHLYDLRKAKFDNFIDLLYHLKENSTINSRQLEILVKLDYFTEFGDIGYLLRVIELFNKYYKCKTLKKADVQHIIDLVKPCITKETEKTFSGVDNYKLLTLLCENLPQDIKTTIAEKVSFQIEYLGYADLIDEQADNITYVVEKIEKNQWGNTFVSLYHLQTGDRQQVKVKKDWYNEYPCEKGHIIHAVFDAKEKWRKDIETNKMQRTGEYEKILKLYSILN